MTTFNFGPWRPDSAKINTDAVIDVNNVLPAVRGFAPLPGVAPLSDALSEAFLGAGQTIAPDGDVFVAAGTATKLQVLNTSNGWDDATRSGDPYATPLRGLWKFAQFGDLLLATNYVDEIQKYDMAAGGLFSDLGGSPPRARFLTVVQGHVVMGDLSDGVSVLWPNRVQWSATGNAEGHTIGTGNADNQDLFSGGPVLGLTGGEVGHVFQADRIHRMTFVPGSPLIFQFDEVAQRGLVGPHTLVQVGQRIYFLSRDGFYEMNQSSQIRPIGSEKVDRFFRGDVKSGLEIEIRAAADPVNHRVFWAYPSKDAPGDSIDRVLIYDWALEEWAKASLEINGFTEFAGASYHLDNIDSFGSLDNLPYSLDSPFWRGGGLLFGVFDSTDKLGVLDGANLPALVETMDSSQMRERTFVSEAMPLTDSTQATVAVGTRERYADSLHWSDDKAMEVNGYCPHHIEGRFMRARVKLPEGADWTSLEGVDLLAVGAGQI